MKNELHSDFLYEVYTQVNEYLTGRRKQFDVPLKYQGTQFQQSVWQELQKIPYGETRSYQEIAAVIGNEKAVRAVGQANNKNPILLIIPCHRVIPVSYTHLALLRGITVIIAGMPTPVTTALLSAKYHGNEGYATGMIFVTTILSLFTLPVWCWLLG